MIKRLPSGTFSSVKPIGQCVAASSKEFIIVVYEASKPKIKKNNFKINLIDNLD